MTREEQIQKLYALIKDYRHETKQLKVLASELLKKEFGELIAKEGMLNYLRMYESELLKLLVFFDVTDFRVDDTRKYEEYKDLKNTCEFFYSIEYIVFKSSLKRYESN